MERRSDLRRADINKHCQAGVLSEGLAIGCGLQRLVKAFAFRGDAVVTVR